MSNKAFHAFSSLPVMFQRIEDYSYDDDRFTKVKIWLMHLGKNLNGSIFEKEVVDDALPTLEYIPVVGFIEQKDGEKDFSDHRYVITKDEKGVRRKYMGSAYGVILSSEDNNAHYEDRVCDDGVTRTFVVVDGVLWNMFEDSSDIMNRDVVKSHSMELFQDAENAFEGYEDEDGFHFTKFSFRAACILGNDVEPAMMNSTVEVQFTMTDFVKSFQSELNDKFTTFTKMVKENTEGGIRIMPSTDFSQTAMELFSDMSAIVSQYEMHKDNYGWEYPRYYLTDIQENEAIVVDRKDNYRYYGLAFSMNGDKPEVDFASATRKKLRFENYESESDEQKDGFDFGKHIEEIEKAAFTQIEEANNKIADIENEKNTAETNYSNLKSEHDDLQSMYNDIKPKYDEYVAADEQRQANELSAQKDAKFAEFEDVLSDNSEFTALKERKDELTIDDIEKECAVLYVKVSRSKANFNKVNSDAMTLGVMGDGKNDNVVQTKYGAITVRR